MSVECNVDVRPAKVSPERLHKRETLATLLFERLDDVPNFLEARRLADLVLDKIEENQCGPA